MLVICESFHRDRGAGDRNSVRKPEDAFPKRSGVRGEDDEIVDPRGDQKHEQIREDCAEDRDDRSDVLQRQREEGAETEREEQKTRTENRRDVLGGRRGRALSYHDNDMHKCIFK